MKRIISYVLVIICIIYNTTNLVIEKNKEVETKNKVEYTLEKEISYKEKKDTFDAVLVIPKINLKKGIYKINDKRNNIEENIMLHYSSTYPDTTNSNFILIAHSGSGNKAYFKDLNKLDTDSLIEIFFKHTKYIYKIDKYYKIEKNGKALIDRDKNKKTITLITCDSKDKTKQLVYIGYLIDEIKY